MLSRIVGAALAAVALSAAAQTWPQRPVTIVVPYGPGGNSDLIARLAASHLGPALGQPVVVENRPGAAGLVAARYVAEAAPDGYTLLMGTASQLVTAPFINTNITVDPVKSFDPVVKIGDNAFIVAVRPQLAVSNLSEFVTYAKGNKASYGSGGIGGITHLASYLFARNAGVEMLHVPYKGGAAAVADLVGGQIDMYSASPSEIISLAKSGKVKLLGISSKKRLDRLPNVPTIAETFPGHEVESWNGLLAPAGTPPAVLDRIAAEVVKMKGDANAAKKLDEAGITPVYLTRQAFAAEIQQQTAMWGPVLKNSGIQAKD
ncbi:Bug family tripartite tricarboxylate transporter substrate binding protein [Pseudorhodoferax sp.]|uniref:Bug family tripartite tricarboxylate transporter substrate binding protein n=1 Tax=Pseudorhodoferax sp. TaxID=1993553 RepID=UPI002DD63D2E|nr:tripartite tricarboxylate transporter substrate binding protein [Pseudorhodoferax sp.]